MVIGTKTKGRLPPKRGHHYEFALTQSQKDALIRSTPSEKTRRILVMLMQGVQISEIAKMHGVSRVAIWRRVKKALDRAVSYNILKFPEEKTPYPSALKLIKKEPTLLERLRAASTGEDVPRHIRLLLTQARMRIENLESRDV